MKTAYSAIERAQFAAREFAFGQPAEGKDGVAITEKSPELPQITLVVGRRAGMPIVRYWPEWEAA